MQLGYVAMGYTIITGMYEKKREKAIETQNAFINQ